MEQPDATNWQNCTPLYCQQCGKVYGWLWYDGAIKEIKMSYCAVCFEDDAK